MARARRAEIGVPLRFLPTVPSAVEVVPQFSVTAAASWTNCLLRLVLRSDRRSGWYELPSSPQALLGTIVHRAIEVAGGSDRDAVDYLRSALDDAAREFATEVDFADFGINEVFDLSARVRGEASVRAAAENQRTVRSVGGEGGGPRRRGREVFLASDVLRLRGTADLIAEARGESRQVV